MFTAAIQKVSKSIFPIFFYGPKGSGVLGTAFFINDKGHFLTAAHVVAALPKGAKMGYLGNIPLCNFKGKKMGTVKVLERNDDMDLALGIIKKDHLPPLAFAPKKAMVGQSIALCGYPFPMLRVLQNKSLDVTRVRQYWQPTIKMDELKPKLLLNKKFRSFLTEQPALPGMSGGPIFTLNAEVIGVTSAVWPRHVPLKSGKSISIENGIGVELSEVKKFVAKSFRDKGLVV